MCKCSLETCAFYGVSPADAYFLLSELLVLSINFIPVLDVLRRALEIGLAHQLAVYDSIYLALAEQLQVSLITVDTRQEAAARALGMTIKPVTDFS